MPSVTQEIAALEERITQAERVLDPEFFESILDDGFVIVGQTGEQYGKAQVIAAHSPAGAVKFQRYETSELQIREFGDGAIVTLRVGLTASGTDLELFFTRFWLKRNGAWKVIGGAAVELSHSH